MKKEELDLLREKVDALDQELLQLLNQRSEVVLQIGKIKEKRGEEVYAPLREKELLDHLTKENKGPFPNHALRAVFGEILSASRALQSPLKVAYLGPQATFTHVATLKHFGRSSELIPENSISKVFDAVENNRAQCGVVPIENSTEGVVGATLDRFQDSSLKIMAEVTIPISHHLLSREGAIDPIKKIYSHPQAINQCRNWLEDNLPGIPLMEVESTARAVERAAEDPLAGAIAGEHAAELYGLKILKRHLEDSSNNMTRFLVIGKKYPPRSGKDKTSVLFSVKDEPGILYRMLEPFHERKINLTKIESRPIKKKVWEYIFFLDMDGHCEEVKLAEALQALEKRCLFVKLLGSYPKAT
ncbi:MAG: prephenate dehydratase [Deltaproteobacteria bacterium]|nr:prephenate dehydratase [Deltaproteobacteria bacterium]